MGVREVVAEGVGVEGNGYGVNRSRNCSQRDRRKTVRCGGGGTPPASGRVDEGREVSSTIEGERDEGEEMVVAS